MKIKKAQRYYLVLGMLTDSFGNAYSACTHLNGSVWIAAAEGLSRDLEHWPHWIQSILYHLYNNIIWQGNKREYS